MLNINHVDHLNLNVSNLRNSINWYKKVFGFKLKEEGHAMGKSYAIVGQAGSLYLCLYESKDLNRPEKGLFIKHVGINIQDFDQAMEKLTSLGVEFQYGGEVAYENSRSLYISDPDGHEIELTSNFGGGLD